MIMCNACGCLYGGAGGSKGALEAGWVWRNGLWYCPNHKPE